MKSYSIPAHERMRIALSLAFIGGFLETYTYRLHGGVFANAQTGNMALFAMSLMQKSSHAWFYLVPIGAFFLGVLASEKLRDVCQKTNRSWACTLVLFEAVVLSLIPFLPKGTPDAVINVLVSFVCSLQFSGFRKIHGLACATTFCTGNLRSATECLYHSFAHKDKNRAVESAKYFSIIGVFIFGACVSFAFVDMMGASAVFICSVLLILLYFVLYTFEKQAQS